jgi:hypothetical protein
MAKPKPEKKPAGAAAATSRVLPMELQVGDRFVDATGEWEVISRPYAAAGSTTTYAHVRKVSHPATAEIRTWVADERIAVRRT